MPSSLYMLPAYTLHALLALLALFLFPALGQLDASHDSNRRQTKRPRSALTEQTVPNEILCKRKLTLPTRPRIRAIRWSEPGQLIAPMAMAQRQKEVIHLSFGAFANHISTHYWNAQESYLDYSPSSSKRDEPRIDADASFRAGQGAQGQETYCPRALLFDLSGEYGNMRRLNPLYDAFALDQEDEEDDDAQEALMHAGNDTW